MIRRVPSCAAAVLAVALSGCADMAGIDSHARLRDAESLGLAADRAEARAAAVPGASLPETRWWLGLGDAQLDALVDEALAGSPDLNAARARLARARSAIATVEAMDRAQVNGSLDLTRQKFSANYIYPSPLGGSIQDIGALQLGGSWKIDFFGKNRAALDAALGSANAATAEADAAAVMLAANVARGYVQWARLAGQLVVA